MPSRSTMMRSFLVVAVLSAVALPAAHAQTTVYFPPAGTYTIDGARVGLEQDGSTWQTYLWFVNVTAGGTSSAVLTLTDEQGAPFTDVTCYAADGAADHICQWAGNSVPGSFAQRSLLVGGSPSTPATTFKIQLLSNGGYAVNAIVQHLDPGGAILSSTALADPAELAPAVTTSYAAGVDEETLADESVVLANPSLVASLNVTLSLYDGQASSGPRNPVATKLITLPPSGRASGLLTELFPQVNFLSTVNSVGTPGWLQGFLSATANQNFGFTVARQDLALSGQIIPTLWMAHPAAPAAAAPASHLSVTEPTICAGNYTGTIAASASVPWQVFVHTQGGKYLVMASGPTVDATGAYSSTTVNWLAPGAVFKLVPQAGGAALQTVALTPPSSCR